MTRCLSFSPRVGGVRERAILLDPAHWGLVELAFENVAPAPFTWDRIGRSYDSVGVQFSHVLAFGGHDKSRWFREYSGVRIECIRENTGGGLIGAMIAGVASATRNAASQTSSSAPRSYTVCTSGDTCFKFLYQSGNAAYVQCTNAIYAGQERCVVVNSRGRWSSGCGISDTTAHHHNSMERADNIACGQWCPKNKRFTWKCFLHRDI